MSRIFAPTKQDAGIRYLLSPPTTSLAIWGDTRQTKLITPRKDTTVAVISDEIVTERSLVFSASTPRLFATSSPMYKALNFQPHLYSITNEAAKTMPKVQNEAQVTFDKLPKSQKTMAATCSVVPKYCTNDIAAENKKFIAIPINTITSGLELRNFIIKKITNVATNEKKKDPIRSQ